MACEQITKRRRERQFTTAGVTPTVPTVADHCTSGWLSTDIYKGEIVINLADDAVYTRTDSGIVQIGGGSVTIGTTVNGGTAGAILFINAAGELAQDVAGNDGLSRNTTTGFVIIGGAPAAATHKLTIAETGAELLHFTSVPDTGKTAIVCSSADLFDLGVGIKGTGFAYRRNSNQELFFVKASDDTGAGGEELAGIGYLDLGTGVETYVEAHATFTQSVVNDDGGNQVGWRVYDPEGMIVQGKSASDYSFRVLSASATLAGGSNLFGVIGNTVEIFGTATAQATLALYEQTTNGTNKLAITVPANMTADRNITLPGTAPSAGNIITTDGVGTWSYVTPASIGSNLIIDGALNIYTNPNGSSFASLTNGNYNIGIGDEVLTGLTSGTYNLIIGAGDNVAGSLTTETGNIVLSNASFGASGLAGNNNIIIGDFTGISADKNIVLGSGSGNLSTGNNFMVQGCTTFILGDDRVTSTTSPLLTAPSASGTDKAGGSLTIAAGKGTGTGIGGDVIFQTSVPTTTGTTLQTLGDRGHIEAKYFTLTESADTAFMQVAIPTSTVAGGTIIYTIEANDGTDFQSISGVATWDAVNKAGTITPTITDVQNASEAASAGTLAATITVVDAGSNLISIRANAVSSLTQTVLRISWQAYKNYGTGSITSL